MTRVCAGDKFAAIPPPLEAGKEVILMIVVFAILGLALIAPALVLAIALGPVILGLLCAAGFGLLVFALGNAAIGIGFVGRGLERAGVRLAHRPTAPRARS